MKYVTLEEGEMWFGKIPDRWDIKRIGHLYKERKVKVSDRDYPPLSVTMQGIVPQLEHAAKTDAHDDRKLIKKGDFVINSRSDRRGSCGISPSDGSCSLINTVLEPLGEMNPEYYNWFFHTVRFAEEFYRWGHGIHDDLWTTNYEEMKRIFLPVPPLPEQAEIADYLNVKCTAIDEAINRHKKIIEKLIEYRGSKISNVLICGLEKGRSMDSTSHSILPQIPSDWKLRRVKYLGKMIRGNGIPRSDVIDDGEPCVRYGELYTTYKERIVRTSSYVPYDVYMQSNKMRPGDVAFTLSGENDVDIGRAVVNCSDRDIAYGGDMVVLKNDVNDGEFLMYAFNSAYFNAQRTIAARGDIIVHLSADRLSNMYVAVPEIEEQRNIVEYCHKFCAAIDDSIDYHTQIISKLEEYRKSIIYNAVTGKIDCRKSA